MNVDEVIKKICFGTEGYLQASIRKNEGIPFVYYQV
jgi:hypothetical protein